MKCRKPSGLRKDSAAYALDQLVRHLAPVGHVVEADEVVVVHAPLVKQLVVGRARRVPERRLDPGQRPH